MGDIAQRGNRLTKGINYDKAYVKSRSLVKDVYDAVAPKHSPGQKGKPHSSKEGRTASLGRTVRDVGKILTGKREDKAEGGRAGYAIGSIVKKAARKFRPGVFKKGKKTHGKDVPTMAAKGGRAGHFAGSLVKNIPKLLKKLGTEIKAQPLPPQLQKTLDEVKKLQKLQKTPRVKKAIGGAATIGKTVKKFAKEYYKKKKLAEDTKKGKFPETESLTHQKGPYVGDVGSERPGIKRREWGKRPGQKKPDRERVPYERHGAKKGGKADKNWIQKAVNPKHKGYCTPMTKKTCTPRRKALARTFKKKAKTGW